MSLDGFFDPPSVAVVGVSRDPRKLGHIIFKNLLGLFEGTTYPVNPKAEEVLGQPVYPSLSDIERDVESAIVAVPAKAVPSVVEECAENDITNVIILSSGFREVGNEELDRELRSVVESTGVRVVGPNCLGIFNPHNGFDSLFLPPNRLQRPKPGVISFLCQSGAIGSAVLDLLADEHFGFAKFASYGNAMDVDETDLLRYLGDDDQTRIICMYIEGLDDGKEFIEVAKRVTEKKPVIAIKGGLTKAGAKAAMSHTGSLAGDAQIYLGAFKQARVITASGLEDMFDTAKVLEKSVEPKGDRIQVVSNAGGFGILSADEIDKKGMQMAELSPGSRETLAEELPDIASVKNPMDMSAIAEDRDYDLALEVCLKDQGVDIILLIVLCQTPTVSKRVAEIAGKHQDKRKKPIVAVTTGGRIAKELKERFEKDGVPCYDFPYEAVRATKRLVEYYL